MGLARLAAFTAAVALLILARADEAERTGCCLRFTDESAAGDGAAR